MRFRFSRPNCTRAAMALTAAAAVALLSTAGFARDKTRDIEPVPTFKMNAAQAQNVRSVIEFLNAYNSRKLAPALASFGATAAVSDCDYRRVRAVRFAGKVAITQWLRARFADHDRLTLGTVWNADPNFDDVVSVDFTRRTSDTLRRLGFPNGIGPKLAAKVVFASNHRVKGFGFGPYGGDPSFCVPE